MKIKIRDMTPEQRREYRNKLARSRRALRAARNKRIRVERPLREQWWAWEEAYKAAFVELVKSPRIGRMSPDQLVNFCTQVADRYVKVREDRKPNLAD